MAARSDQSGEFTRASNARSSLHTRVLRQRRASDVIVVSNFLHPGVVDAYNPGVRQSYLMAIVTTAVPDFGG
jgi:hypothetical protein